MKTTTTIITLLLIAVVSPVAHATRVANYSIEILIDGHPVTTYQARGTTYIEACEHKEYAVRLTNHSGERIAIALSIDGLNSIDAKTTTAREAAKWVLAPWESITVDGWQTSATSARRFFFTTEEKSYGEWLGKTTNLGVISAVVFREKRRLFPAPIQHERSEAQAAPRTGSAAQKRGRAPVPDPTPDEAAPLDDDIAATGIGREVDNPVRRVRFVAEPTPTATFRIRYEYRPQLVRLGILPAPYDSLGRREQAQGFTDWEFAPDPYRR